MQIEIEKGLFLSVLGRVQSICGRGSGLETTRSVLIRAFGPDSPEGESVEIVATDMKIAFRGRYPVAVHKSGEALIHAKKLFEIVKSFPSDMVPVKKLENRLFRFSIRMSEVDDEEQKQKKE